MSISKYGSFLLAILLLVSCVKSEDYDLEEVKWSPSYAFPIASGELSLKDLLSLEDSLNLGVREDDVFFFNYEDRFIFDNLGKQIEIPDAIARRSLKIPYKIEVPPNSTFRLPDMEGEIFLEAESRFRTIEYKTGQLYYSIASSLEVPVQVDIRFPSIFDEENTLAVRSTVNGQETEDSASLSGYTADLTTGTREYNSIPFQIDFVVINNTNRPVEIPAGETITTQLQLEQQDFSYIEGFFGNLELELSSMTLPIQPFDELLKHDMQLSEVDMEINIHNQYGVPINLSFTRFVAVDAAGQPLAIETSPNAPVLLEAAKVIGDQSTTRVEVVNANEIISHNPEEILLSAYANLNEGRTQGSNFITDSSNIMLDISAEIPLAGSFRDLEIRDTIDADLRNSFEEFDIKRMELNPKLVNEFPLEGDFQIYMLDENQHVLDSLLLPGQTDIIRASTVNAQGDLVEPGVYDQLIQISSDKLRALQQTTQLIISARLNTIRDAEDNSLPVRFKSQYRLGVELGAVAELDISITP